MDVEEQVAALPLRIGETGAVETLLVTSRGTGRWVLPKGNLMKGVSRAEAAAIEAQEEAGIVGRVVEKPYRRFEYWKRRAFAFHLCRTRARLGAARAGRADGDGTGSSVDLLGARRRPGDSEARPRHG